MNGKRLGAVAVGVAAVLSVTTGTAYADPAPPGVGYSTTVDAGVVRTVVDGGSFDLADGSVVLRDSAGESVAVIPLEYSVDSVRYPIAAAVDGRTLTLTPQAPDALAVHPVFSPAAYQNLVTQIEIGWLNGGSVSAGIGAGIGAVVGCVLFVFVGCIPGAAIGGAVGAVNGITNANPAVAPAVFEFVRTLP